MMRANRITILNVYKITTLIVLIFAFQITAKSQTGTDSLQLRAGGGTGTIFLKLYSSPSTSSSYGIQFPSAIPSYTNQILQVNSISGTRAITTWTDSTAFKNTYWALLGNTGTDATALNLLGTKFLGTTDAHSLVFKTNNTLAGYIGSSSADNLTFGISAGAATTITNGQNTFIGNQAGQANSTGTNNTFLGYQAGNPSTGSSNTALGSQAGVALTSGARNTFIGMNAGMKITSPGNNTFVGYAAGANYPTTQYGTFVGSGADATTNSLNNVAAIGYNALVSTSNSIVLGATGSNAVNVGIGISAPNARLEIDTTGSSIAALKIKSPFSGAVTDSLLTWNFGDSSVRKVPVSKLMNTAISATVPLSYNSTTGALSLGYDNTTIGVNGSNQLSVQGASGTVLYGTGSGTSAAFTGVGTTGQVLQSNGAAAPTWVNNPATTQSVYASWGSGYSGTASYGYTGTTLTLPPGKWLIASTILLSCQTNPGTGQGIWIRLFWADSKTVTSTAYSSYTVSGAGYLISGYFYYPGNYGLAIGQTVINNTTTGNITLYLIKGNQDSYGAFTCNCSNIGASQSTWAEDNVIAMPIK